ncbi:MAG: VanZ family protein [Nitrospirota bacterium]
MNDKVRPASERGAGPSQREHLRTWLPAVIYIALILIMAAQPAPRLPRVKNADKYAHACAYGILAVLSYRPFFRTGWRRPVLMTVLLGAAVGMADEGIQWLGNVRSADGYDLLADLAGVAVGALVIRRFIKPDRSPVSKSEVR